MAEKTDAGSPLSGSKSFAKAHVARQGVMAARSPPSLNCMRMVSVEAVAIGVRYCYRCSCCSYSVTGGRYPK